MKILAIRGKNLASLEGEFEIDFTVEPLRSSGIFAITGPTGAGKSTILDALCLALFDDAPRLNKAESSVNISDVEDKTITQKDSRNILRRGAGDGFAEVDFMALNGYKYRSRWTVRRSRGKINGALQATAMRLENLSSGLEEQGTKKNLLDRIVELIGLSFDQFTRAVLLAQGDFANFLKAKQNEKAELLEKLTGTEVYSAISVAVYQKHEEARKNLELVVQRMKDVALLSEEELHALQEEKGRLEQTLIPLKEKLLRIAKLLDWIRQDRQLRKERDAAEAALQTIRETIEQAAPRYDYLALLDLSMEIRNEYLDLQGKSVRLQQLSSALQQNGRQQEELEANLKKTLRVLSEAKTQWEVSRQEYERLKPEIERAKSLDFKLSAIRDAYREAEKECTAASKQLSAAEGSLTRLKEEEAGIKKKSDDLQEWFARHEAYRQVVPNIALISNHLAVSRTVREQGGNMKTRLIESRALLDSDSLRLKELEEEGLRLNALLPTEVLQLRAQLEEGKACPVCGSLHHPFSSGGDQSVRINEQELEAAKKKNADQVLAVKERIERSKKSITEFETYIQNYRRQYEDTFNELKGLLPDVPGWEERFKEGSLQAELAKVADSWTRNQVLSDSLRQEQAQAVAKQEAAAAALLTARTGLKERSESLAAVQTSLNTLQEERKSVLENRPAAEVELACTVRIEQQAQAYEQARKSSEELERTKAALAGTATQLEADRETTEKEYRALDARIEAWLEDESHPVSAGLLPELMAKTKEWIDRERMFLHDLKNRELVARTTWEERQHQCAQHRLSELRPEEGQTEELLLEQQQEWTEEAERIAKRHTEIQVALSTHERGKAQLKSIEQEKMEKESLYENWAKLNDLLGSASGNRFKTIAQGYTLDVLLGYANKHLEELTGRYKLEKIPGTLALQVTDNDMLGELRSVHSLSGGESFLISLALALGLSSLSSNRMKIESLFIDEGFGALDIDTLSVAMDALDNLRTQGRKIGVISHVEEMKERITTQIQVIKSANGRSTIKTVGSTINQ